MIAKTVDATAVNESGQSVTEASVVTISEHSEHDPLTVTARSTTLNAGDRRCGDLLTAVSFTDGGSAALAGAPSATWTYKYATNAGSTPVRADTDMATVTGRDDEGTSVSDTDDATVTYTNATPAINVVKTANPTTISEGGEWARRA